jgi:hypothetical protein
MCEALMPNLGEMQRVLKSSDWSDLKLRLLDYVEDFSLKIVDAQKGFQI